MKARACVCAHLRVRAHGVRIYVRACMHVQAQASREMAAHACTLARMYTRKHARMHAGTHARGKDAVCPVIGGNIEPTKHLCRSDSLRIHPYRLQWVDVLVDRLLKHFSFNENTLFNHNPA